MDATKFLTFWNIPVVSSTFQTVTEVRETLSSIDSKGYLVHFAFVEGKVKHTRFGNQARQSTGQLQQSKSSSVTPGCYK